MHGFARLQCNGSGDRFELAINQYGAVMTGEDAAAQRCTFKAGVFHGRHQPFEFA